MLNLYARVYRQTDALYLARHLRKSQRNLQSMAEREDYSLQPAEGAFIVPLGIEFQLQFLPDGEVRWG